MATLAYRTPREVAAMALDKLGVVPEGGTATAEALDYAVARYEDLHEELYERGVAVWPSQTVPLKAAEGIADIIAARIGQKYRGYSPAEAAAAEQIGFARLFRSVMRPAGLGAIKSVYF